MIKDNFNKINQRIGAICSKLGVPVDSVSLVVVSKGRAVEQIKEAIEAGATDIGENKVQEALLKYKALSTAGYGAWNIKWHMLGHLQTNKAKEAVAIFDMVQSVDSLHLAAEIDKQARKINKIQDILIEIKTSSEATKSGLKPYDAVEVIKGVSEFKNVNIKGLMTIAPPVDDPQKSRPYFRAMKELKDKVNELRVTGYELRILSMGMTDDFEAAIEEGSTMIRLGRAIFEG